MNEAGISEKIGKDVKDMFVSFGMKRARNENRLVLLEVNEKIELKHLNGGFFICVGLLVCSTLILISMSKFAVLLLLNILEVSRKKAIATYICNCTFGFKFSMLDCYSDIKIKIKNRSILK